MTYSNPTPGTDDRGGETSRLALLAHVSDVEAPTDLIGFVKAARRSGRQAFYWEKQSESLAIAGIGSAWTISAAGAERFATTTAALRRLRDAVTVESSCEWLDSPILFGGFAFSDEITTCDAWSGFPPARVTLPELSIVRRGDRSALIRTVDIRPDSDIEALALELSKAVLPPRDDDDAAMPTRDALRHPAPGPDSWMASVERTVDAIRRGSFDKLVMARSCRIDALAELDLARILRNLGSQEVGCTLFSFSGQDGDFVGATPETLVTLDRGRLRTHALAGTTPRGTNADRDQHLRNALAASGKDRSEHDIVVRGMLDDLGELAHSLEVDPQPEVVTLKRVQHLRTSLRGRVAPNRHILEIVEALHPSPAVGGYPKHVALNEIARREQFERGWYAAPIGWTTLEGDGEFAVGLRSGVVRGTDAWIFAGAGIVRDSDPRAEYLETELKLRPMLAALGQSE